MIRIRRNSLTHFLFCVMCYPIAVLICFMRFPVLAWRMVQECLEVTD